MPQLHVSASSLRTLLECPREFYYRYIRGFPRQDHPARMLLGTAVHKALAEFYACLKNNRPEPNLDTLVCLAGTSIAATVVGDIPIKFDDGEDPTDLVKEAERVLEAFLRDPFRPHKILGVELRVSLALAHPDTGESPYEEALTAIFDLVIEDEAGVVYVIDHKITARFAPPKSTRFDLQLGLYAFAATELFPSTEPVRLAHHVLVRAKTPRVEVVDIPRAKNDSAEAIEAAFSGLELIHVAVTHPEPLRLLGRHRSWRCGSCSYRRQCAAPEREMEQVQVGRRITQSSSLIAEPLPGRLQ